VLGAILFLGGASGSAMNDIQGVDAVAAGSRAALTIPHQFAIGAAVLVGGAVAAIIGPSLTVLGTRMRDTRRLATGAAPTTSSRRHVGPGSTSRPR
jgi:hypothetical protein